MDDLGWCLPFDIAFSTLSQVDYREIVYRQIFKLDTLGRNYYQEFFSLISLLLTEPEREELASQIVEFRKMFDDGGGKLPTFFLLESSFYEMRLHGRTFVKLRTAGAFKKIKYGEIAEKLNDVKQWCLAKLYEVQKNIRFSSLNAGGQVG